MKTRLFSLFCAAALMVSLAVPAAADFSDVTDPDTALAAAALEGMGVSAAMETDLPARGDAHACPVLQNSGAGHGTF